VDEKRRCRNELIERYSSNPSNNQVEEEEEEVEVVENDEKEEEEDEGSQMKEEEEEEEKGGSPFKRKKKKQRRNSSVMSREEVERVIDSVEDARVYVAMSGPKFHFQFHFFIPLFQISIYRFYVCCSGPNRQDVGELGDIL